MRTRHRQPVVFTLYMMDVFCCALGCVTLLWLLGLRQTKQKADEFELARSQLLQTQSSLTNTVSQADLLRRDLQAARSLADDRARELAGLRACLVETQQDLRGARDQADQRAKELAGLDARLRSEEEKAAGLARRVQDLTKALSASRESAAALGASLSAKESELAMARRQAQDSAGRLRVLQKTADTVPELQAQVREMMAQKAAAEARSSELAKQVADVQKDLADARRSVIDLQGAKRSLADEVDRVRAAADNRFAGIALTGKRVIFVVDMSGSMDLVDASHADPAKWLGVKETVLKIMTSLPDLEAFQVLVFSTDVRFLFLEGADWVPYDKTKSPAEVRAALDRIEPKGNTNMYAAFEAAFRFKQKGLDAIYLLSDGLPNMGEPVPEETARAMRDGGKETELSIQLGRHVREKLLRSWNPPGGPRVRINAVGFFYESPDIGSFLWALTRENEGSFVGMSKP